MSLGPIYLDNSATTPVADDVVRAMQPYFGATFGNASSMHSFGRDAAAALDEAHTIVGCAIGARASEIVFTGCGTEADNLAMRGVAFAMRQKNRGNRIITALAEHHAVEGTAHQLHDLFGFDVTFLPVDGCGRVDPDDVRTRHQHRHGAGERDAGQQRSRHIAADSRDWRNLPRARRAVSHRCGASAGLYERRRERPERRFARAVVAQILWAKRAWACCISAMARRMCRRLPAAATSVDGDPALSMWRAQSAPRQPLKYISRERVGRPRDSRSLRDRLVRGCVGRRARCAGERSSDRPFAPSRQLCVQRRGWRIVADVAGCGRHRRAAPAAPAPAATPSPRPCCWRWASRASGRWVGCASRWATTQRKRN